MSKAPFIIAIGSSTGGPAIIMALLQALPPLKNITVVIAQHIHASYFHGFMHWLERGANRTVLPVRAGAVLEFGQIYLAPIDGYVSLHHDRKLVVSPLSPQEFATWGGNGAAFLMTGMGEDGARGLSVLNKKSWYTGVQHPATCAVSGMPSAALALCKEHHVLTPEQIITWIKQKEQQLEVEYARA